MTGVPPQHNGMNMVGNHAQPIPNNNTYSTNTVSYYKWTQFRGFLLVHEIGQIINNQLISLILNQLNVISYIDDFSKNIDIWRGI